MTSLSGVTPLASYRSDSSSRDLKVPSSRTVWAHGMLAAPGMWPGRWAVSLMPGGAMISPANSAGLRQGVAGRGVGRDVGAEGQAVVEPVLAAAVEDPDITVAEQLELPVGPGGEPVVVVAVENDRRVRSDARLAEQLRE